MLLLSALGGLPVVRGQLSKPNLHGKPVDAASNKFLQRKATDDVSPPAPRCAAPCLPCGEREKERKII